VFKRYDRYKNRICLIEGSKQLTFDALEQLIDEFVETYLSSASRKLVFIEVNNNVTSVVAYLACLRNSHVVMLLNPESHEQNTLLADKYEANLFLNTVSHQVSVISQSTYCHQFHDELALLLGTSGSTGSPKLVKLSRQNIMANTRAIIEYLALTPSDRAITSLKFSYSYGLSIINSHLEAGASVVLTDHGTLSDVFWKQVKSLEVTSFSGVPYHFESFDEQGLDLADYPSLRYFTQAGGKLSARLVGKFATLCNQHNKQFFVMYGQTEASPRISYLPPELACEYPQAIGRAVPGGELYLLDDSGQPINETGIEGELVCKGPNLMMGYAATPLELATCNDTDYLKTGDLAKKVCGDIFEITGRKSRFAKPLGIRVNLEDVQLLLKNNGVNCAVTSNKSEMILIGYLPSPGATNKAIIKLIQGHIKIPVTSIVAKQLVDIPRRSKR
tara:strand:- start:1047 stop:2381 length:1335 start_codon:yes stop_codon:yes gene_type:complete